MWMWILDIHNQVFFYIYSSILFDTFDIYYYDYYRFLLHFYTQLIYFIPSYCYIVVSFVIYTFFFMNVKMSMNLNNENNHHDNGTDGNLCFFIIFLFNAFIVWGESSY